MERERERRREERERQRERERERETERERERGRERERERRRERERDPIEALLSHSEALNKPSRSESDVERRGALQQLGGRAIPPPVERQNPLVTEVTAGTGREQSHRHQGEETHS